MFLSELTRPPTQSSAGQILAKAGYKELGQGHFANLWIKPGQPLALKLYNIIDHAYESFVKLAQTHPNQHFPTFRGRPIGVNDQYAAVRVELLDPPSPSHTPLIRQCGKYLEAVQLLSEKPETNQKKFIQQFRSQHPTLAEAINLIFEYIMQGNPNMLNDIDFDNTRLRGNTIVFIDPVGWGGPGSITIGESRLDELFTKPLPVQGSAGSYTIDAGDGRLFELTFTPTGDNSAIEIVLSKKGTGAHDPLQPRTGKLTNPYSTSNDFGGNPISLYTTVMTVTQQYIAEYQPKKLMFYGFDERQNAVYQKMMPYMRRVFPDYDIHLSRQSDPWSHPTINAVRRKVRESIEPTEEEIHSILNDKQLEKNRRRLRKFRYVATGDTITHPGGIW